MGVDEVTKLMESFISFHLLVSRRHLFKRGKKMFGNLDIRRPRGRQRKQKFTAMFLGSLFLLSPAGGGCAVAAGASFSQEGTIPTCALNTDATDCVVGSAEESRPLRPGTSIEREIAGGERHLYKIAVSPGQFLQAVVEQLGIDVTASICTQDGQRVAEVDRQSGSWGPETISLIAKEGGEYRLQVRPIEGGGVGGRYVIKIKELRVPAEGDEVQVNAERVVTEGGKYFDRGRPDCLLESIKKYEQARKLWESLGNDYEVAVTLYGLGWSYTNLGAHGMVKFPFSRNQLRWSYETREEHLTALEYFDQALKMMRALNSRHGQAMTLVGLAYPNLYLGRNEEASKNFSQARHLFSALSNRKGEAIAVYGLGWAHAVLGEDPNALDSFLQALRLRQEVKDRRGEANTLAAISRIHSRLGNNLEARDYGRRALDLYGQLSDKHGQASTHNVLGWIYKSLGRAQESLRSFEEAIKLRGDRDPTGKANSLYGMARVQSEQGDLTGALSKMKEVIETIEGLRTKGGSSELRTYYFANVQDYYEFYVSLLMSAHQRRPSDGHAEAALWVNERARARELLAVLARSEKEIGHEFDSKLAEPIDAAGIKELLDDGTLLLEYSLGVERSYFWLVSSTEVLSYVLPRGAEIEDKALLLYQLLTERNQNLSNLQDPDRKQKIIRADVRAQEVAEDLSRMLLGSVAERLDGKRLVVITQGALQLVPFGMLPKPAVPPAHKMSSKPLVVDHEVVSLPSASILRLLRRKASRPPAALKTIAVLADPVFTEDDPRIRPTPGRVTASARSEYKRVPARSAVARVDDVREVAGGRVSGKDFRRLPGTRWEAQQIISLVPKDDGFMALDFSASRDTAMSEALSQYRIIHFATHAFVDDANPALSKIVFSQFDSMGRPQNGDLTLADIHKLRLQADLVVLSACRTALGADTKGEGLIGLTGGFMHSEVPRILVSLWPISDSVTAEMMARIYRKMLGKQKMSPAAALREVQIEMWKDARWNTAYFWAPFVIHGEWRW